MLKINFAPSPEWTTGERLVMIGQLTGQLEDLLAAGAGIDVPQARDALERVRYLIHRPAGFLQDNRRAILDGQG